MTLTAKAAPATRSTPIPVATGSPVVIPCADGFMLHATLHEASVSPLGVVLIHPATAVPEALYTAFATYLVSRGFTVLTYDYRGIGGSRQGSLKGFKARMRDWADLDAEAVTLWARKRFSDASLTAIGHSFGGHAIGLCPSSRHLEAAVFIASHAGSMQVIRGRTERLRVATLLKVAGPVLCKLLGFMPGKALRLGEDLPRGVMQEWRQWIGMDRYFFDDPSMDAKTRFARPRMPVLAIGFEDDPWATSSGIDLLTSYLSGCEVERRQLTPAQAGASIGHMGFFRRKHRAFLWAEVSSWLEKAVKNANRSIEIGRHTDLK
jgi:predicted alpha/beta hydrolase